MGGEIPQAESVLIAPALLAGETVVVPDTEGEEADFSAGPVYGYNTLDSLRAALSSPVTGLAPGTKIGLAGYSGGAIATEWAAQLAPKYAPEINSDIVGAAMGGVLVDPAHNLKYVEGSSSWASIIPMALVGLSRAFHLDLTPYLTEYGQELMTEDQHDSITNEQQTPGLTWSQIAKPAVPDARNHPRVRAYRQQADRRPQRHADGAVPRSVRATAAKNSKGRPGTSRASGRAMA